MARGWWVLAMVTVGCGGDTDGDGFADDEDCDPLRADVFPDAPEPCDGRDNDCSGAVDDTATCAAVFGPTWRMTFVSAEVTATDADGDAWDDDALDVDAEPPDLAVILEGDGASCATTEVLNSLTAAWGESCDLVVAYDSRVQLTLDDVDTLGNQRVDVWSWEGAEALTDLLVGQEGADRVLTGTYGTLTVRVDTPQAR